MKNESVAILDIRSDEVCFLLGSKGVNKTFVFRGMHSEPHEGYCVDGFFDEGSFRKAVMRAISSVQQNYQGVISEIYVGVPSPFVSVLTKGHTLSFHAKRKLCAQDIDSLFDSGISELSQQGVCIEKSAMYFTLGDNRKYFNKEDLYGVPTTLLKGALCYYFVPETFYAFINETLEELGFTNTKFIPSTLAQAMYLLPEKKREGYAFLLDIGFMTSSISVVYGNGIVHEETFNCGIGSVLVALMDGLHIDCAVANEILTIANISGGSVPRDMLYYTGQEDIAFSVQTVNEIIKCSLDELCEQVDAFLRSYYKEKTPLMLLSNTISVTGEGISAIRGAAEHVSRRVNWLTEIVFPDLPYYDKPTCSSRIALLSAAISTKEERGWFRRIFNCFGGRKK
ncbi:MAG: hypothetical protein IKB20_05770 [Clostridia bacterium]|nr:hypothetical protein [Clostridia bacterium]